MTSRRLYASPWMLLTLAACAPDPGPQQPVRETARQVNDLAVLIAQGQARDREAAAWRPVAAASAPPAAPEAAPQPAPARSRPAALSSPPRPATEPSVIRPGLWRVTGAPSAAWNGSKSTLTLCVQAAGRPLAAVLDELAAKHVAFAGGEGFDCTSRATLARSGRGWSASPSCVVSVQGVPVATAIDETFTTSGSDSYSVRLTYRFTARASASETVLLNAQHMGWQGDCRRS